MAGHEKTSRDRKFLRTITTVLSFTRKLTIAVTSPNSAYSTKFCAILGAAGRLKSPVSTAATVGCHAAIVKTESVCEAVMIRGTTVGVIIYGGICTWDVFIRLVAVGPVTDLSCCHP